MQLFDTHFVQFGQVLAVSGTKTLAISNRYLQVVKSQQLCWVEEHQHQLAHQCSPNIIGIWEWGICGLMGWAFIT